jgi:O-antigen/teichoic acid export membrane protein
MQKPSRASYDTAWTLKLLQALCVTLVIAALAPVAASYFKEPRVTMLLWTLCAMPLVEALRNIGHVEYRKHLMLDKEFKLLVTSKVLTVASTVVCALMFRDYRALVVGLILGNIIEVAGSYLIHPFRPTLTLAKLDEFRGYWLATLFNSVGHFTEAKVDEMLVGRFGSTSTMGLYSLASELGQLPVSELAAPLNKALVPALSLLQREPARLRAAFLNYQGALLLVLVPAGMGLAAVADPFVHVLLGEQWVGSSLIVRLLAIFAIVKGLYLAAANAFVAIGRPALSARMAWIGVALLVACGLGLAPAYGVLGIAVARLASGAILLLIAMVKIRSAFEFRMVELLNCFVRPCVAGGIMVGVLALLPQFGSGFAADLMLKVGSGALIYGTVLVVLWHLAGRPDGGERLVMERVARIRRA